MRHIITVLILFTLTSYASGHSTSGITKVKMLNSNEWYAVGFNGLFMKTTNAGITWTSRYLENGTYHLWDFCFFNSSTGIVAGASASCDTYLARTTDGGNTWNRISSPAQTSITPMTFANERIGYMYGNNPGYNSSIYKTTNGGLNWYRTSLYQLPFSVQSIFTLDTLRVYAALSDGYILFSSNGGANWSYINTCSNSDIVDVCFLNQNTGVFCSRINFDEKGKRDKEKPDASWFLNFGATTNKGISWDVKWMQETDNSAMKYSGNSFYVIGDYNKILRTSDFGENWVSYNYDVQIPASPYTLDIKGSTFLVGGFGSNSSLLIKSTNSGVNWTSMPIPPPYFTISGTVRYSDNGQTINYGMVKAFKLDRNSGNIIVFDSTFIEPNGTYSLNHIPQDTIDIGVYPNSNPVRDYIVTYYPSTPYWQQTVVLYPTGNMPNVNIYARRMVNTIANNSVSGKVMKLTNSLIGNLKDAVVYAMNGSSYVGFAISDENGVYHVNSLPSGNIKFRVDRLGYRGDSTTVTVTSASNIDSVNFYLNRLIIGIKQTDITVPTECMLFQNYPNPFNPSTSIKFQIKEANYTSLKIYDILGKEAGTLVNERLQPGTYSVTFNAVNLPSGIYFYRLNTGAFSDIKKLTLIK